MPSGNTSLCLKRHARGIASRHMLKLFIYGSLPAPCGASYLVFFPHRQRIGNKSTLWKNGFYSRPDRMADDAFRPVRATPSIEFCDSAPGCRPMRPTGPAFLCLKSFYFAVKMSASQIRNA